MPGDFWGVVLAVSLIFLCWGMAFIIKKKKPFGALSQEVARKIVHIGVSNFAFIYLFVFENDLFPILGLLSFALINIYIETHTGERRSWGTVEYPLIIALLIAIRFKTDANKAFVACALLGMGYGDGFAAIVGKKWGKIRVSAKSSKTVAGSLTVLLAVFIVCLLIGKCSFTVSFVVGLAAALAEAYTPFGLDNISVPLVIYFGEILFC